jgi:hypothetical protein
VLDDDAFAATVRDDARAAVSYYAVPRARQRLADAVDAIHVQRRLREGA